MLDPSVQIPPLTAHAFLRQMKLREFSLEQLLAYSRGVLPSDPVARLGVQLSDFLQASQEFGLAGLVQRIGEEFFFKNTEDHDQFIRRVEVVRTFVHLVNAFLEKNVHGTLTEFLAYLDRLENYGHDIELAVFAGASGVHVHTLHSSKGLEYENVWIAHLDESSLMKGRRNGFTLPARIEALASVKDEASARRELYVAITRAKERCSLLWSARSYTGASREPAPLLFDIPEKLVERRNIPEIEKILLDADPKIFVAQAPQHVRAQKEDLARIVAQEYTARNVSVTLLNNFFTCPWTWYFRNMLQVPEAKTESLLVGTAVHAGIEYFLNNRDSVSEQQLLSVLEKALEREYVRDEKLARRIIREAEGILKDYQKIYLPEVLENARAERSVSYKDPKRPHLSFYGKIDLTEYEENRVVVVTDFKTGSVKNARTIEKLDEEGRLSSLMRQLAMYSYLIENSEKGTEVRASRLLFVEHEGDADALYSKHIGEDEIELLKKDIADYDELLQSGEWINRPCNAETYGKNTECQYCALAKRLYE
jgi:DNA helicase-2/ATP-dependent DNA helicase PcrA